MRAIVVLGLLGCLSLAPLAATAQNSGLDRHFGTRGLATLRDPQQRTAPHHGVAACAAPGGGLNVLAVTEPNVITLFRLDAHGKRDLRFGRSGVAATVLPLNLLDDRRGACMADGRIVVVASAYGAGSDRNLHLVRVLPDGRLDAGFGQGGTRIVDMDQYVPQLADLEMPIGLNLDAAGNILVSMQVIRANSDPRPGLASLDASGTVRFARVYELAGIQPLYASAAGMGPNGRLWMAGSGHLPVSHTFGWYRAELDPTTGALLGASVATDHDTHVLVDAGRVLPNGVMAVAARTVPRYAPIVAYRPRVMVFRESGASHVDLPVPAAINTSAPSISPLYGDSVVIPIAGDRLLFGGVLGAADMQWQRATYAAVVQLGATAAQDRVDTRFGQHGATQFAWRTAAPCATGAPPRQRPAHFSNWGGRPVLAGWHDTDCSGAETNAFAARLLLPTDVLRDSFEE